MRPTFVAPRYRRVYLGICELAKWCIFKSSLPKAVGVVFKRVPPGLNLKDSDTHQMLQSSWMARIHLIMFLKNIGYMLEHLVKCNGAEPESPKYENLRI